MEVSMNSALFLSVESILVSSLVPAFDPPTERIVFNSGFCFFSAVNRSYLNFKRFSLFNALTKTDPFSFLKK